MMRCDTTLGGFSEVSVGGEIRKSELPVAKVGGRVRAIHDGKGNIECDPGRHWSDPSAAEGLSASTLIPHSSQLEPLSLSALVRRASTAQ